LLLGLAAVARLVPLSPLSLARRLLPVLASGVGMAAGVVALKPFVPFFLLVPFGAALYALLLFLTRSIKPEHLAHLRRHVL
jgi:hypothetical protein